MLWKCCTQYASKFGNLSSGHRIGKGQFLIPIPKKDNAKECSNLHTMALISRANKVMLKILHSRLQQYVNWVLPDVPAGFRKGRGTRDQIANIRWITEKAREFQKNIYFCFIDYPKDFDCVGKIRWRRDRLPTPVFWPGEFHGLSPWGHKELDLTEWLSLSLWLCGSQQTMKNS